MQSREWMILAETFTTKMLSLSDDDVDFADNDNDNGYDGSDILHRPEHRPSLRRAHGEKSN